jgi:hypothetical protein
LFNLFGDLRRIVAHLAQKVLAIKSKFCIPATRRSGGDRKSWVRVRDKPICGFTHRQFHQTVKSSHVSPHSNRAGLQANIE